MNFVLNEIKLWFKDDKAEPKSYFFVPNKVNVITGDATTGKTSFWSIITYCLLTGKVNIADEINERVQWYGINFSINGMEVSIARHSPERAGPSSSVYYNLGKLPLTPTSNSDISIVRDILDKEFGITEAIKFPYSKELGKSSVKLSYKYFLLFNSLTEDIIGAYRKYFDTDYYGDEEYSAVLKNVFALAIGINNIEVLKACERIQKIDTELNNIKTQIRNKKRADDKFEKEFNVLIDKLKKHGIIDNERFIETIEEAQYTIDSAIKNIQKVVDQSKNLAEIELLKKERFDVKTQLYSIEKYQKAYNSYKKNLEKSADSLNPIKFLRNNLSDQLVDSYETEVFLSSLEISLKNIQKALSNKSEVPIKIVGDTKLLNSRLSEIDIKIEQLTKLTSYKPEESRIMALGEVKGAYEQIIKGVKINPVNTSMIAKLEEEKEYLKNLSEDNEQVKFNMYSLLNESIQRNYNKLNSLNFYKESKTVFNASEMLLQLQPKGQLFPIENIGSKSNYMLMHLCFYLGLHEHMIKVEQIHTPQFLFIDQPSIPYYNGNDRGGNDDKSKLLDAFSLLNSFIEYVNSELKTSFQIFMVEHAPKEYWEGNNLTNFHTVSEFINGTGLIPKNIYSQK